MKRLITAVVTAIVQLAVIHQATALTVDFQDLSINPADTGVFSYSGPGGGIYYKGNPGTLVPGQKYDGTFTSRGASLNNEFAIDGTYLYEYWSGFAYSTTRDTVTPGLDPDTYAVLNDFSAYSTLNPDGNPADGFNVYAVGYYSDYEGTPKPVITLPTGYGAPISLTLANTTWTALYILDAYVPEDYFTLTISGLSAGNVVGSIDVVLADYRNGASTLLSEWQTVDLTGLGTDLDALQFSTSSSDGYTPSYFAVDNVTVAPEPSSALLIGGVLALGAARRRRMANRA